VGRISAPATPAVFTSLAEFIAYYARDAMAGAELEAAKKVRTSDPRSPKYITELLTGIIRGMSANPEQSFKQTTFITKRINDHALFDSVSVAPWRRSPAWLIWRVTLQTTLHDLNLDERFSYKSFMIYTLSSILNAALRSKQPDYLLFFMNAKLARRVWKLSNTNITRDGLFSMDAALDVNTLVSNELEQRWKRVQQETTRKIDWKVPSGQGISSAAHMNFSQFLPQQTKRKKRIAVTQSHFGSKEWVVPGGKDHVTRTGRVSGGPVGPVILSTLSNMSSAPLERAIQLYDFELWVADELQSVNLAQVDMVKLNEALNDYIDAAMAHYKGNPEQLSIAFLTILELWMFIDRKVIDWAPELKQFSPEIPVKVSEPLLLPFRSQMERVAQLEMYLERRQQEGNRKSAIFYNVRDRDSFVSWYVGQSAPLQATLVRMERQAEQQTRQKEVEMERMNSRYRAVKRAMDFAPCSKQQGDKNSKTTPEHFACTNCLMGKMLNQMKYVMQQKIKNSPNRLTVPLDSQYLSALCQKTILRAGVLSLNFKLRASLRSGGMQLAPFFRFVREG
jgi:hypothetical protein